MGGFPLRVLLSLFWPWSSYKVVCKINKSANLHPSQVVYKSNSIPRRHSDIGSSASRVNRVLEDDDRAFKSYPFFHQEIIKKHKGFA